MRCAFLLKQSLYILLGTRTQVMQCGVIGVMHIPNRKRDALF